MKATPSVLVIGSANTDLSVKVGKLPGPGETVLGGEFTNAPGGKGANQAVAAARAGVAATFIARIGRDAFDDRAVAGLIDNRINIDYLIRDEIRLRLASRWFSTVDDAGEKQHRCRGWFKRRKLSPADLGKGTPRVL